MGVNIRVYVVYGVKVDDYDQLVQLGFSQEYHSIYDNCPVDVIIDGMNGDYMVFGKILYASGNFRYDSDDDNSDKIIDVNGLANIEKEYKLEFNRLFPKFNHYMEQPFQLIALTHYS